MNVAAVQRRTLRVVVASQVLGGAGLAAGITVGGLIAEQMLGGAAAGGLPSALFTIGSAATAFLIGRSTQRRGRRIGLATGFFAGGVGAIGVVVATVAGSVPLLFASLLVYGAGTATNLQARYAGADLATARTRARAISVALVSTTAGAVAGPNLAAPLGSLAVAFGLPPLTGPFLLAAVACRDAAAAASRGGERRLVVAGAAVMVTTQIAMVAIMTMTPVHMRAHMLPLAAIGLVIGLHIAAMYLPSLLTGLLADRFGRLPVAGAAAVVLLGAGLTAAFAPDDSVPLLVVALILLGLGWNLGLISGTTLIVDGTDPATRARTQGTVDVLIAVSGTGAAVTSGVVVAAAGYETLALAGGLLALVLLVPLALGRRRSVS